MSEDPFEAARPRLLGIAYRMLGSRAEAEDVVGDVAVRWTTRGPRRHPRARGVARHGHDAAGPRRAAVGAAAARGVPGHLAARSRSPPTATRAIDVERRESLTMGFLLLLERLTPIERAVFVLHDVLEHPYELVAEAVGRTEDACRQALSPGPQARHRARSPHAGRAPAGRGGRQPLHDRWHRRGHRRPAGGPGPRRRRDERRRRRRRAPPSARSSDRRGWPGSSPTSAPVSAPIRSWCRARSTGAPAPSSASPTGGRRCRWRPTGDVVTAVHIVANPAKLERLVASLGPAATGRPGVWEGVRPFRHRHGQPVR